MTDSFAKQLSQMPTEYLACRVLGHDMKPETLDTASGFYLGLTCHNGCGLEIEFIRDAYGNKVRRSWYDPEKGYLFQKTGRLSTEQRLEIEEAYIGELKTQDLPKPPPERLNS
jgi:hypothetical protein